MRPGMQCLLEILRREALARPIDEAERDAALALAEEEHVLPWVARCLRARQTSTSSAISDRLEQIERDAAIAAFYWSSELKGVLRAFDEHGLRVVPLKGPLLAERLYGNVALRTSRDLDLLVARVDLPRAEALLAANGFIPGAADDYHRPWRRQGTMLELHHNIENPRALNFHIEGALDRARPASFQGERCWQFAEEDELLFLCLHAARHRFERLSLVLDLQFAFEKLPASVGRWQPRPEVAGLDHLLILGFAMARRLHPALTVAPGVPTLQRPDCRLEDLADRLWQRLLTEPSEPLDWRAVHAFFVEIESPGWPRFHRRLQHLRILSGRVIEPDYAFAARFGLRRKWQVRMLRPLRLLSDLIHP